MRSALRLLPTILVVAFCGAVLYAGPKVTAEVLPPSNCQVVCGTPTSTVPFPLPPGLRVRQHYYDACTPDLVFLALPETGFEYVVELVAYPGTATSTLSTLSSVPLLAVAVPRSPDGSELLTVDAGRPLVADFGITDTSVTSTMPSYYSAFEISGSSGSPAPLEVWANPVQTDDPFGAVEASSLQPLGVRIAAERCSWRDAPEGVAWQSLVQQPIVGAWLTTTTGTIPHGYVVEFTVTSTSTLGWVELALSGPPPPGAPPLRLIDPGDLQVPMLDVSVTSTAEFRLQPHPHSLYPVWVPALPVTSTMTAGRLWLEIGHYEGLELAVDANAAGNGPPTRLWRLDASGEVEELFVDLALRVMGFPTSTAPPIVSAPPPQASSVAVRAHPSPFRGTTRIGWRSPRGGELMLEVFDLRGRRVRVLASGSYDAEGWAQWDGTDENGNRVPAGTYLVQARLDGVGEAAEKVVLLR